MPRLLLEVIVQSVADAREATRGGADRLEVVRAVGDGGLTPSIQLVRAIAAETSLPLRVMVRENAGYTAAPHELCALRDAAFELHAAGVDGIVIGFARDGEVALDDLAAVLGAAPGVRVTFHRAFDALSDPLGAIEKLAAVEQIDRILTSGGTGPPALRCQRLHGYTVRAAGRFEIVAGGGVDDRALALFAQTGCVREVHVGRAARVGNDPEAAVSSEHVQRLRALAG
jgi:copper homeostasis protein